MSGRGRPPKPTALKEAEGNRGKRKANPAEPKPNLLDRIPAPPRHLNEDAASEWTRIAHQLHELGLLTDLDLSPLVAYCASFARFLHAERQLHKERGEVEAAIREVEARPDDFTELALVRLELAANDDDRDPEDKAAMRDESKSRQTTLNLARRGSELVVWTGNGNLIQNPLVGISRRAAADMLRFAAEFGMTPSARSRIDTEKAALDASDPAASYF
jgi:phage terminase small subunit